MYNCYYSILVPLALNTIQTQSPFSKHNRKKQIFDDFFMRVQCRTKQHFYEIILNLQYFLL